MKEHCPYCFQGHMDETWMTTANHLPELATQLDFLSDMFVMMARDCLRQQAYDQKVAFHSSSKEVKILHCHCKLAMLQYVKHLRRSLMVAIVPSQLLGLISSKSPLDAGHDYASIIRQNNLYIFFRTTIQKVWKT